MRIKEEKKTHPMSNDIFHCRQVEEIICYLSFRNRIRFWPDLLNIRGFRDGNYLNRSCCLFIGRHFKKKNENLFFSVKIGEGEEEGNREKTYTTFVMTALLIPANEKSLNFKLMETGLLFEPSPISNETIFNGSNVNIPNFGSPGKKHTPEGSGGKQYYYSRWKIDGFKRNNSYLVVKLVCSFVWRSSNTRWFSDRIFYILVIREL